MPSKVTLLPTARLRRSDSGIVGVETSPSHAFLGVTTAALLRHVGGCAYGEDAPRPSLCGDTLGSPEELLIRATRESVANRSGRYQLGISQSLGSAGAETGVRDRW